MKLSNVLLVMVLAIVLGSGSGAALASVPNGTSAQCSAATDGCSGNDWEFVMNKDVECCCSVTLPGIPVPVGYACRKTIRVYEYVSEPSSHCYRLMDTGVQDTNRPCIGIALPEDPETQASCCTLP